MESNQGPNRPPTLYDAQNDEKPYNGGHSMQPSEVEKIKEMEPSKVLIYHWSFMKPRMVGKPYNGGHSIESSKVADTCLFGTNPNRIELVVGLKITWVVSCLGISFLLIRNRVQVN